jgi:RNA polymerase sigma factor (sigma-70 family)
MNRANAELFSRLISDNSQRIYRICRAYARQKEDQEDLFGEVVFQLWKSLASFRNECHIHTWLYRITLNVCMRQSVRQRKWRFSSKPLEGIQFISDTTSAQQDLEKQEILQQLYACLDALPETDKSLVLLFMEDLPYREIAHITGLSENNVAQKLSRIKKKLFTCLQSEP